MIDIVVVNHTRNRIPRRFTINLLTSAAEYFNFKKIELSVLFTSKSFIQKMNYQYRHQNKATDVLSFAYARSNSFLSGDIIICYSIAASQARQFHHSFKQEIKKLLLHSFVHLLGYDHKTDCEARHMSAVENQLASSLKHVK